MRKSENFDLNLYEGTDIFNPLTTDVPNYEKIDAQMEKNYNLSVGKATELKTGTVHALTRENADCPMIHFTATSNFTSNDTFTVDGVQVSALLVDGSTLPTNCYIIGSEVICYLKGTLLTFFLSGSVSKDSEKLGGELPTYYSKKEDFERLETRVNSMNGIVEKNTNDIVNLNESVTIHEIHDLIIEGGAINRFTGFVENGVAYFNCAITPNRVGVDIIIRNMPTAKYENDIVFSNSDDVASASLQGNSMSFNAKSSKPYYANNSYRIGN